MSETAPSPEVAADPARLVVPHTFLVGRLAVSVIVILLVLVIAAGFAGLGPGHNLLSVTHKTFNWIDSWSGLTLDHHRANHLHHAHRHPHGHHRARQRRHHHPAAKSGPHHHRGQG
jgi:hypothetical protein